MASLEELERRVSDLEAAQANTRTDTLVSVDATGRVLSVQLNVNLVYILAGTVSYTPAATAKALIVRCIGGGGGGGAVVGLGAHDAVASGGGGGGFAQKRTQTIKTYTVAVGGGGQGGAAGGNNGLNGGNTTFDNPSICTANGGVGGAFDSTVPNPALPRVIIGGAGGTTAGEVGDLVIYGNIAPPGFVLGVGIFYSGGGAFGPEFGCTGGYPIKVSSGGNQAPSPGGGGGCGAAAAGGAASASGGNGADGLIIVEEVTQAFA